MFEIVRLPGISAADVELYELWEMFQKPLLSPNFEDQDSETVERLRRVRRAFNVGEAIVSFRDEHAKQIEAAIKQMGQFTFGDIPNKS
jgi:hypothetical protein